MLHPVLLTVGPFAVQTHDFFVAMGVLAATGVFAWEVRRRGVRDERIWGVVAGALVGGALLARIGTWAEHWRLATNADLAQQWLFGARSILSGLVGAYAGALVAKRITGLRSSTGDLFAPAVALGMAIGRIGCLLTELPGTPTGGSWGVVLSSADAASVPRGVAGVPLHPSFLYEILFQLAAFALIWWLRDRFAVNGALFALYLLGYAAFRFAVEFVRGNEIVAWGLTRPQWFLLACAPFAIIVAVRRARSGGFALRPAPTSSTSVEASA